MPADDWECNQKSGNEDSSSPKAPIKRKQVHNKEADVYIVANDEMGENLISNRFDDGNVEIIIGTGVSSEEEEEGEEGTGSDILYDGSGNGSELMELDDLMVAENRETEDVIIKAEEDVQKEESLDVEKKEGLQEVLQTIKTKAEIGQPSSNIDPNFTAQLQRLSQLVKGYKETSQDLGPDQLNAFLAHFSISNKFNSADTKGEEHTDTTTTTVPETPVISNSTKDAKPKPDANKSLNPETKVVLSNYLPKRYGSQYMDHGTTANGGYSNSQIVVNRPEGAVLFALPPAEHHHFAEHPEYSSNNSPKISEDTLKTVLELSKQMIASQNMPNVIKNPAYYAAPIMQPILLSQSPFSTDYYGSGRPDQHIDNVGSYPSVFSTDYGTHNYRPHKKPAKRPHDSATTIIHNNVIPLHLTSTGSGDKLDSYGQNLNLYPPVEPQAERPDTLGSDGYQDNAQPAYENNKYVIRTTRRPSSMTSTASPAVYGNTHRPFDFHPTSAAFNQYFTPSEHLNNENVNSIFQTTDNYGNMHKNRRPSSQQQSQSYQSSIDHENSNNQGDYGSSYSQAESNNAYQQRPSPTQQIYTDDLLQQHQPQYPQSVDDDNTDDIQYTYGHKKPVQVDGNLQLQYSNPSQSVFSSNKNPYMSRPSASGSSNAYNPLTSISSNTYNPSTSSISNNYNPSAASSSSNAYNPLVSSSFGSSSSSASSSHKNKYSMTSSSSSSSSAPSYGEGSQLVNFGGNFISVDVFQNSILPLMGGNAQAANVEVITCAAGVRQPNSTDCTRYYVCSKKDGKVLSYSCPPYTAFNAETRICDARTYALCSPEANAVPTYSVSENKRLQMEAMKALQEAKRKQAMQQQQQQQQQHQQAMQAQHLANILQQYQPQASNSNSLNSLSSYSTTSAEQNMLQSYMQQAASMASLITSTTKRPHVSANQQSSKKRKYYCKEGDKIADQTSISSYFVCYKNAQGQMKGHKMTCSKGLLFCPKSTMCTLPSKCS